MKKMLVAIIIAIVAIFAVGCTTVEEGTQVKFNTTAAEYNFHHCFETKVRDYVYVRAVKAVEYTDDEYNNIKLVKFVDKNNNTIDYITYYGNEEVVGKYCYVLVVKGQVEDYNTETYDNLQECDYGYHGHELRPDWGRLPIYQLKELATTTAIDSQDAIDYYIAKGSYATIRNTMNNDDGTTTITFSNGAHITFEDQFDYSADCYQTWIEDGQCIAVMCIMANKN